MKMRLLILLSMLATLSCSDGTGSSQPYSEYLLSHVSVNPTEPGVTTSAAHFLLKNNSASPIVLIGAESEIANRVEIHAHTMIDGAMTMTKADPINVAPGGIVEFVPGGYHVMFMGVRDFIKEGDEVIFSLLLENGEKIVISATAHAHDGEGHDY